MILIFVSLSLCNTTIDDRIMLNANRNHRRRMFALLLAATSSGIVNGQEEGSLVRGFPLGRSCAPHVSM